MPREKRCVVNSLQKGRVHFSWQAQYLVKLECDFSWQAQYLVKLECDFSWQAQHVVTFWEIAGTRNVVFFHTKCVSKMGRVRSPKRRVRDDDFMVGSCSESVRIVFLLAEAIQRVSNAILNLKISWQARRSIW